MIEEGRLISLCSYYLDAVLGLEQAIQRIEANGLIVVPDAFSSNM